MGLPSHFSLVPAHGSSKGSWFQGKVTTFIRPLMSQHVSVLVTGFLQWQKLSRVIQKFGTYISSVKSQTIPSQISLIHGRSHLYRACHSSSITSALIENNDSFRSGSHRNTPTSALSILLSRYVVQTGRKFGCITWFTGNSNHFTLNWSTTEKYCTSFVVFRNKNLSSFGPLHVSFPTRVLAFYMLDVRNVEPADMMDTPQCSLIQREEAEK